MQAELGERRSYVSTKAVLLPRYWEHMPHQPALIAVVLFSGETGLESRISVFDEFTSCEVSVAFLLITKIRQTLSNNLH